MLFRTIDRNLFVGVVTPLRSLIYMSATSVQSQYSGKVGELPVATFQWSNDRECVTWDHHNRAIIMGGWSVYLDIFHFAVENIYRKGTDARRARYAESLTNRMMFGDENRRPDLDELRGMADAMIGRSDTWGERAYFQRRGVDAIERLAKRPTIEVRA
jgi:hypothetical protein